MTINLGIFCYAITFKFGKEASFQGILFPLSLFISTTYREYKCFLSLFFPSENAFPQTYSPKISWESEHSFLSYKCFKSANSDRNELTKPEIP